jgi:hypothetical protein
MMLIEETKDLIRRYYQECNAIKGNPAKFDAMIDAFFPSDFVGHTPTGDTNFEKHNSTEPPCTCVPGSKLDY